MAPSDRLSVPAGLMAFWASIDVANQVDYQRWHNAEHMPERVGIPGFLRGARYRAVADAGRFLMYYETEGAQVLTSDSYLAALNNPTARTRRALAWFQRPVRNVYRCAWQRSKAAPWPAPIVATMRFARAEADEVDPTPLEAFDVPRVVMYALETAGSTVVTGESTLHGAISASSGGLLRLESWDLRLMDDPAAQDALSAAVGRACRSAGITGQEELEVGTIEFSLSAAPERPA